MPMTPTPAASGKGEGPLLWGEGSPLSRRRGSSSRVLPLPPSSSPALTSPFCSVGCLTPSQL